MAPTNTPAAALAEASTDTALCLIPPPHLWEPLDRLRSLYDKAYSRWPPHINLVYPFVRPECLEDATQAIGRLDLAGGHLTPVTLQECDTFHLKHYNTIHLRPSHGSEHSDALVQLSNVLRGALGRRHDDAFNPHMTIGQSYDSQRASHSYLMEKIRGLTGLSWDVTELTVLVRDQEDSCMKIWGYVDITTTPAQVRQLPTLALPYPQNDEESQMTAAQSLSRLAYHYSPLDGTWRPLLDAQTPSASSESVDRLIVASYNVLGEFEWPPKEERYHNLIANILSNRGTADILVLEEVTDHFLQFLLSHEQVRSRYPYSTHGPPEQPDIGPLPNHLNIVVLSRFELQWRHLPFSRKHKGASIVTFPSLRGVADDDANLPLVLAASHLTHGLVDGAVQTKKKEMQRLLSHLSANYESHPVIIAGDFNLPTSSYTLEMARKTRHISPESHRYLQDFDSMLADAGLQDAWLTSRIQNGESSSSASDTLLPGSSMELFEGEQGATFDPRSNELAAKQVGSGLNNRPQRYDRILVNGHLRLRPGRFNMFGMDSAQEAGATKSAAGASDHWGVRCLLMIQTSEKSVARTVELRKASSSFGGLEHLKSVLSQRGLLPNPDDITERKNAIELLQRVLQCQREGMNQKPDGSNSREPQFILAPVGSYGLGVWTSASDLDLLCIGGISSKTFFGLAVSRLRKSASEGITIVGRVKASSGTMLLLNVNGIKVDLHYCGVPSILEQFPDVMKRPASDPAFALPAMTLNKLKPLRDVHYLCRSIPDMTQYRIAHLLIKAWAKSRGLYGSKFGLLGGINISVLLVPVCKTLALEAGSSSLSVTDILTSFFYHYAHMDWRTQVVCDPFFHSGGVSYHRMQREPLCLLGWHPPRLNTALNASASTVHTIASEFVRADSLLSQPDMTWEHFLDLNNQPRLEGNVGTEYGAVDFLRRYKRYVRIDINYWGSSSKKRHGLVGWIESRCVMLLVELDKKAPEFNIRIWPQRFVDEQSSTGSQGDDALEYHGCYLVGLEFAPAEEQAVDAPLAALQYALTQFEGRIHGDAKYYDPNTCWMAATVVKNTDIGKLQLDQSEIEEGAGEEDDFSSDEEDELEDEDDEGDDENQELARRMATSTLSGGQRPSVPSAKLRSAVDVMHRLRWDPNMDSADYIVGYEDRFTGACERLLDLWKSDQTDEEFIPQHRILYFKRRSDGEVVWERRTRIDKIFGSGVSS